MRDGDFGDRLLQYWMARAFEGESQIQENIQWDVQSKGWIPVAQALGAVVGLLMTFAGAALMLVTAPRLEGLGTLAVAALGLAVSLPGALLAYRQVRELVDPFGKTSPVERKLLPLIEDIFNVSQEEEPPRRVVEVRTELGEYVTDSKVLGLDEDRLAAFAKELVRCGWDLAESRWGTYSPVFASYTEYRATRTIMEDHGLVRRVNPRVPNSGYEMTRGGMAAVRAIADSM